VRKFTSVFFLFCFVLLQGCCRASVEKEYKSETQKSDWTFLVYMEADERRAYWAVHNINSMVAAAKDPNVTIIVQLHMGGDTAWRYRVEKGIWNLEGEVPVENNHRKDLVESMRWGTKSYPANHYCLVFWGQGFGILDPRFVENSTDEFPWIAVSHQEEMGCDDNVCLTKGTLFNSSHKTYMTNNMMVEVLRDISEDVLGGKKLDVLGTDCCKMAMVEVGYQIRDYVGYFIGSQNCQDSEGWDYEGIFNGVKGCMKPLEVARFTVDQYRQYNQTRFSSGLHTLSALDLNCIDRVINDINTISALSGLILTVDPSFKETIDKARARSLAICDAPYYTDLGSFYNELLVEITKKIAGIKGAPLLNLLIDVLHTGKNNLDQLVLENCTGRNIQKAQGASIYFPRRKVDPSYLETMFAKETRWLEFLESIGVNE